MKLDYPYCYDYDEVNSAFESVGENKMKLTKTQLREMIKEELLNEGSITVHKRGSKQIKGNEFHPIDVKINIAPLLKIAKQLAPLTERDDIDKLIKSNIQDAAEDAIDTLMNSIVGKSGMQSSGLEYK